MVEDFEDTPWATVPERAPEEPATNLSVSELTARISGSLSGLGRVRVEGELSGLKRAASGHVYFDLKDASARLSCVVWRSNAARVGRFNPSEGDQVVAHGKLDVYAPRGNYSLVVDRLEPVGAGQLLARFEALKADLRERGWFERARPLPSMPKLVGIVTSRDGAALRDFLRTRSLRWPGYPVRLCHAPVQGPGAAEALAHAISALAQSGVDLIVLTRGGGSLEDLWAFNEEPVARAIHECPVPVVSGVGHETDVTLADFVADHRAHTPTDAAQSVIPDRAALSERLARAENHLFEAMDGVLEGRVERLERAARSRVLRGAAWMLDDRERELQHLLARLCAAARANVGDGERALTRASERLRSASPRTRVETWERRLLPIPSRLAAAAERRLDRAHARLAVAAGQLDAISPLAVLARGYSLTTDEAGRPVRDAGCLSPGDRIHTRLGRGALRAVVEQVEGESDRPPSADAGEADR